MEDRGVARADPERAGPDEEREGHRDQPDSHDNNQELVGGKGSDRLGNSNSEGSTPKMRWKSILGGAIEQEAEHFTKIAGQDLRREPSMA